MHFKLGDIEIDLVQKQIKNLHLSVHPPDGRVRIAAPFRMDLDTIRIFAASKINWIKKQQAKLQKQERETPRSYISRESHYYLGKRYLLKVIELNKKPKVVLKYKTIELYIKPGSDRNQRQAVLEKWYREKLRELISAYIYKWEKIINVSINKFGIRKMKTKWGTCNTQAKRIWLNLDLIKKPIDCIEYIIVHEMVHLLERKHNEQFITHMNKFLPRWKILKEELNQLPI